MEKQLKVLCPNSHTVSKICANRLCQSTALICQQQDCQFSTAHTHCFMVLPITQIIRMFKTQQLKYSNINQKIAENYDQLTKMAQIQKEQFLASTELTETRLVQLHNQLHRFLAKGPSKNVTPSLVHNCIEKSSRFSEQVIKELEQKTKRILGRLMEEMSQSLKKMRRLWGDLEVVDDRCRFSPSQCHQSIEVSENELQIRSRGNGQNYFAIVVASVLDVSKVRLRITKYMKGVCLGVANREQLIRSSFFWPQSNGIYIVQGYQFKIIRPQVSSQYQMDMNFMYKSGDVVEMEFLVQSHELKIHNLTENRHLKILNVNQAPQLLHFCVRLYYKGQSVDLIQ